MWLIWGIMDPRINHEARINHAKRKLVRHGFTGEAGEASGRVGRGSGAGLGSAQAAGGGGGLGRCRSGASGIRERSSEMA